jgi:hypothetical protein
MSGYQNLPYIQGSVRRAMRGATPPFLPEDYGYEPEVPTTRPPAMQAPGQAPPPLEPPVEDPTLKRVRELAAQGAPQHPKHGLLRRIGETVAGMYVGPENSERLFDADHSQRKAQYGAGLKGATLAADASMKEQGLRAELEMRRKQTAAAEATEARQRALMNAPPRTERQVVDGALVERGQDGQWRPVYGQPKPREFKPGYGYERDGKVDVPVPTPLKPPPLQVPGRDVPFSADVEEQKRRMAAANRAPERPASQGSFRIIETEKQRALAKAERETKRYIREQGLDKPSADPQKEAERQKEVQTVYDDMETEKEQIQGAYEAQIESAGGHVAAPPQAPKVTGGPAPAKVATRAHVAAYAKAKNITEQQATAEFQQSGYAIN